MRAFEIIEALEARGWLVLRGFGPCASHVERCLILPEGREPVDALIELHEIGHALDCSLALDTADGLETTRNQGRVLRAECVAWSWALSHARAQGWALDDDDWAAFLRCITSYIERASLALGPDDEGMVADW